MVEERRPVEVTGGGGGAPAEGGGGVRGRSGVEDRVRVSAGRDGGPGRVLAGRGPGDGGSTRGLGKQAAGLGKQALIHPNNLIKFKYSYGTHLIV